MKASSKFAVIECRRPVDGVWSTWAYFAPGEYVKPFETLERLRRIYNRGEFEFRLVERE